MTGPVLHGTGHFVNKLYGGLYSGIRGLFGPNLRILKLLYHGFTDALKKRCEVPLYLGHLLTSAILLSTYLLVIRTKRRSLICE